MGWWGGGRDRHPPTQVLQLDEDVDDMELRREAAHNLALLYKLSGNEHKARAVLREHCSV